MPIPLEPGHLPEDTGRGAAAGVPRQAGDSQVLPNLDGPTVPTTGMDHPRLPADPADPRPHPSARGIGAVHGDPMDREHHVPRFQLERVSTPVPHQQRC